MPSKIEEARERAEVADASLRSYDTLQRIADSLERLVIAADSIATALSLKTLTIERTEDCPAKDCTGKTYARFFADQGKRETLDELIARHERITGADSGH